MSNLAARLSISAYLLSLCSAAGYAQDTHVPTAGADVILGVLDNTQVYASDGNEAALAMATTSCNAGDAVLNWFELPDNKHPAISMNLYRLSNGRMVQIGQSWVKHGFFAVQGDVCGFGCKPNPTGDGLGVGCSDPYGAGLNRGPDLGARSEINPATGHFDGATANQHDHPHPTGLEHGLQVATADLGVTDARYFVEGHYIAPDDAAAGNGLNNASYREVAISRDDKGNWRFANLDFTVRQKSAIEAWTAAGATLRYLDEDVGDGTGAYKARVIVGYRVYPLADGRHRYEYAVYNMNSDRGIASFSVPVGSTVPENVGFSAVRSHDEGWSNDPWPHEVRDGTLTWSVKPFSEDPKANAVRWGTTYNFWFESAASPGMVPASLGRFKDGPGAATLQAVVEAPAN